MTYTCDGFDQYVATVFFFDSASRYIHLKKSQPDAQFIFSVFRQTPLHVSGVSIAHHQEVHLMDATSGTIQLGQKTVI